MQFASRPARPTGRGSIVLACVIAVLVAVAAVVVVTVARRGGGVATASHSVARLSDTPTWGRQADLPLGGVTRPHALAVTPAGATYVVCCEEGATARLVGVEPGASAPTRRTIPSPAGGIAADRDGNLYLAGASGVTKLTAGAAPTETALAFPPPAAPMGIAVDGAGAVHLLNGTLAGPGSTDEPAATAEVWTVRPGARAPDVKRLDGVRLALAIAVDDAGTTYVADGAGRRVVKFAAGASEPTDLPIPEGTPNALAVDRSGALYVATAPILADGRLIRFAADGSRREELPLEGVSWPPNSAVGLGVDRDGDVYVADHDHDRVVRIPRGER